MSPSNDSPLLLVGWDFQQTPVELRERLAFSQEQVEAVVNRMRQEGLLSEAVIVSTCNRSEVYGVRGPALGEEDPLLALSRFISDFHGVPHAEAERTGFRHMGADAVRHLFRVSAGLESLALGEHQILGQVREAFRFASQTGLTRTVLNRLFQKALEAGKRVRNETGLNSRPISIPGVAIELAQKIYENLAPRHFLILGAGETSSIFYDLLVARGAQHIEVVNRTLSKAEALCQRAGKAYPWAQLAERLPKADVVVSAVSSAEPVLTQAEVHKAVAQRRGQPLFFLDLGIPRNVDPAVADLDNAFLYAVDDLQEIAEQNRQERQREVAPAMEILEAELQAFLAWYGSLAVVPTITALRRKFELTREAEFDVALEKMSHLDPADREKLRVLAQHLVRALLRRPTAALKEETDATLRLERAEAAQFLFDLEIDEKD